MAQRSVRRVALCAVVAAASLSGCGRRGPEPLDIAPGFQVNRQRAPLGSAVEVTYTWTVGPQAKKLDQEYQTFAHFLDSHRVILFTDDHLPTPPTTSWEPGKTYTYKRTVFIPVYPYVGDVQVGMGLVPAGSRRERPVLKGEDMGLREYKVGQMELLPQTENIFLVYKEGWHNPETSPQNPSLERTWTKKDALVSFKNPKKDIVIYLEADTNSKAFDAPPVLTVSVNGKTGVRVPIENSEVFLRKIRVQAADLGDQEWVDLRLSMNQSFVPKAKGVNAADDRELGLLVYHLYVADAARLGEVSGLVDAGPVTVPTAPAASATTAKPAASSAKPGTPRQPAPVPPAAKPTTGQ